MRLAIVGCSGSFPGPDSPASCYVVEHEGRHIVLDLGSGAFGALQRHVDVLASDSIDAVVLSHLHPDHCLDLTAYYVARKYRPGGPGSPLAVLGPAGTAERLARAYDMPASPGMTGVFEFRDHVEVTDIGPFRITTSLVVHPVPAYAIRVEAGGRALVYSGDTGVSEALVELAQGADVALFEASFLRRHHNPPGLHLTAAEAAEHAVQAGVERLILTHLVPWNDDAESLAEAAEVFRGDLSLARAGAVLEV